MIPVLNLTLMLFLNEKLLMKFALRINDLEGMTVGCLRELLEGLADENTFALDRVYDLSGEPIENLTELVIELENC